MYLGVYPIQVSNWSLKLHAFIELVACTDSLSNSDWKRPQDISCPISCCKSGQLWGQTSLLRAFIQLGLHLQECRLHSLSVQSASLPGCLKGERLILTPSLNTSFFNLWQLSVVFSLGTWIKTLPTLSHSESQPCLQCLSAFTVRLKNIYSEYEMLRVTYFVRSLREQNSSWIFLLFGNFSFNLIRTLLEIKHWLFQIITLNFTGQYCIFFTHILLCVCPSLPDSKQPV